VDTLSPLSTAADASVTCDGHMTVTGRLAAGGVQLANNSVVVPGSLTVGGVSFASLSFTAVDPLRKVVNLQTGAVELRLDTTELQKNLYWGAGKVNSDASVLASKGGVAFTVTQTTIGNYRVDFASPHPNGVNYVISLTAASANYWIDQVSTTSQSFLVALRASNFGNISAQFHFSVLA
jgi:hypothetical protein